MRHIIFFVPLILLVVACSGDKPPQIDLGNDRIDAVNNGSQASGYDVSISIVTDVDATIRAIEEKGYTWRHTLMQGRNDFRRIESIVFYDGSLDQLKYGDWWSFFEIRPIVMSKEEYDSKMKANKGQGPQSPVMVLSEQIRQQYNVTIKVDYMQAVLIQGRARCQYVPQAHGKSGYFYKDEKVNTEKNFYK